MNSDYFRDVWYKGTYLDNTKVRQAVRDAAKNITEREFALSAAQQAEKETAKGAAKWLLKAKDAITQRFKDLKPGDLIYDSLNEGIEETMEEVAMDSIKGMFKGMNALGIVDENTQLDFGITPEDMMSRYFTSFVGGAIGGAVFSLHNRFDGINNEGLTRIIKQGDGLGELVYLIREGKLDQVRRELDRLHKNGSLGSTNLSGTELEYIKDGDSNKWVYKPADQGNSQNDLIHKQLGYYLDRISEVVKEEGMDLSDSELQTLMLMDNGEHSIEELKFMGKRMRDNED